MDIVLTPGLVAAYKSLVTQPKENGLPVKSITEFFTDSETVTAKHTLAAAYLKHTLAQIPKVVLYIIMDEIFGPCTEKDSNGNLGYKLSINNLITE